MQHINPLYNISQIIQFTKYFSHPTIYPLLHNKQLSLSYTLIDTSTNIFYTKHHQNINQTLQSQPISNTNFSPPPLSLQLQSQPQAQSQSFQPLPVLQQSQPQPAVPQPQAPAAPQQSINQPIDNNPIPT